MWVFIYTNNGASDNDCTLYVFSYSRSDSLIAAPFTYPHLHLLPFLFASLMSFNTILYKTSCSVTTTILHNRVLLLLLCFTMTDTA